VTTARTRLGVLGWPVTHSRSPQMQNAALAAAGLPGWRYQLLPAPPPLLPEIVAGLPGAGFRGANVTIPHKAAAFALATTATERATAIGAANTLLFEDDGTVAADNTDGPALVAALAAAAPEITSAVVLGAGGTARAALWALRDAGVADIRVWNRTPQRARDVVAELGGTPVQTLGPADVLVNTTSVGLDGGDPFAALPLQAEDLTGYRVVVDFVYRPGGTALLDAARRRGAETIDGLELLVLQGAIAFELFTARPAPVEVMRAAVRGRG
jgi:shikimate dehydrogenase